MLSIYFIYKINHFIDFLNVLCLVAQMVKNLPAIQETCFQSLGWEDPLEKEMAIHSSILPGESHDHSPWDHKELDKTE